MTDGAFSILGDPAVATHVQRPAAFVAAFRGLQNLITAFAALPVSSLDRVSLQARLAEIGHGEGATSRRPDVA